MAQRSSRPKQALVLTQATPAHLSPSHVYVTLEYSWESRSSFQPCKAA